MRDRENPIQIKLINKINMPVVGPLQESHVTLLQNSQVFYVNYSDSTNQFSVYHFYLIKEMVTNTHSPQSVRS